MAILDYDPVTGKYVLDKLMKFPVGTGPLDTILVRAREIGIPVGSGVTRLVDYGITALILADGVDGDANRADFCLPIPYNIDLSVNPVMILCVTPSAAQTVGSDFRVQQAIRYVADGENYTKVVDETLITDITVSDVAGDLKVKLVTLDASLMAQGDHLTNEFSRTGTHVNDDRNGDMMFLGVMFYYRMIELSNEN